MAPEAVFVLYADRDDPRAGAFSIVDKMVRRLVRQSAGRPLRHDWQAPRVVAHIDRDFPQPPSLDATLMGGPRLVISARAAAALSPVIGDHAELLPLDVDPPGYVLLHPIRVLDVLDEGRSEVERDPDGRPIWIHRYEFRGNAIGDVPIFKIPQELGGRTFVTDAFADAAAGLSGFVFTPVWSNTSGDTST